MPLFIQAILYHFSVGRLSTSILFVHFKKKRHTTTAPLIYINPQAMLPWQQTVQGSPRGVAGLTKAGNTFGRCLAIIILCILKALIPEE